MVDQDVAKILAEIRERVSGTSSVEEPISEAQTSPRPVSIESPASRNGYASLTVLARAWDRLPPLISNRTGMAARLELWFKAKLKRAFRWFTWEQVNFNAATHHTFLDVIESLAVLEQQQREKLSNQRAELLSEIRRYQTSLNAQQGELNAQRSLLGAQQAELNARFDALETAVRDFQSNDAARFLELVKEFRERDERLLDEQRVCFKQLSLELSESQTMQDRARRELDSRLAKLESEENSDKG